MSATSQLDQDAESIVPDHLILNLDDVPVPSTTALPYPPYHRLSLSHNDINLVRHSSSNIPPEKHRHDRHDSIVVKRFCMPDLISLEGLSTIIDPDEVGAGVIDAMPAGIGIAAGDEEEMFVFEELEPFITK